MQTIPKYILILNYIILNIRGGPILGSLLLLLQDIGKCNTNPQSKSAWNKLVDLEGKPKHQQSSSVSCWTTQHFGCWRQITETYFCWGAERVKMETKPIPENRRDDRTPHKPRKPKSDSKYVIRDWQKLRASWRKKNKRAKKMTREFVTPWNACYRHEFYLNVCLSICMNIYLRIRL